MLGIVASYQSIQFQEKSMIQIQQNGGKPHFGPDLVPLDPNFLFKNVALSVTRYHGQLYNIRKKLMTQSWENLVMDGQTERLTGKSDFIGSCPTDAERPKL